MSEKKEEGKVRMVDFREIQVKGLDNEVKPFDLSKHVGNVIFSQAKDVAEDEFSRDIYNNGRVEITKERAEIVKKYLDSSGLNYAAQTAIKEAIKLD